MFWRHTEYICIKTTLLYPQTSHFWQLHDHIYCDIIFVDFTQDIKCNKPAQNWRTFYSHSLKFDTWLFHTTHCLSDLVQGISTSNLIVLMKLESLPNYNIQVWRKPPVCANYWVSSSTIAIHSNSIARIFIVTLYPHCTFRHSHTWYVVPNHVASYPGCVGGERRPGINCFRMCNNSQNTCTSDVFPYYWKVQLFASWIYLQLHDKWRIITVYTKSKMLPCG